MKQRNARKVHVGDKIIAPKMGVLTPTEVLEVQYGMAPRDPRVKYPLFMVKHPDNPESVAVFSYLFVTEHVTKA